MEKNEEQIYSAKDVKDFITWVLVEKFDINVEEDKIDDLMFSYGYRYGGKTEDD